MDLERPEAICLHSELHSLPAALTASSHKCKYAARNAVKTYIEEERTHTESYEGRGESDTYFKLHIQMQKAPISMYVALGSNKKTRTPPKGSLPQMKYLNNGTIE